ncbi:MAG: tetratricopeptide repeat protein [Promethearchaeota archaeon]
MTSKEFTQAEELMIEGKFNEALKIVEDIEKRESLPVTEQLTFRLLKSKILNKQGHYEKALKLAERLLQESQNLKQSLQELDALIEMAIALERLGKIDESLTVITQGEQILQSLPHKSAQKKQVTDFTRREASLLSCKAGIYIIKCDFNHALNLLQRSLTLRKEFGHKKDIATALNNLGTIYWYKGDLNQALDYYQQSLSLREELGHKQEIAASLNNIGVVYGRKGELDQSLEYYQRSLVLREELGNKQHIAASLNNIGIIYSNKYEFDSALEYYKRSLALRKELGNKQEIAIALNNMGILYSQKSELDRALEHLGQSLTLFEEIGNDLYSSESLLALVIVALEKSSLELAQRYLERLQEINNQVEHKLINQNYRVAKALVLKTSTRMRNRAKSEELLEKVVEEEIINFELVITALLHLCELHLIELRLSGDPEVLSEIRARVNKLVDIAKEQHLHWLLVETYILQSRLALLELDIQGAQRLLESAHITSQERGLRRLTIKIAYEKASFQEQIAKWENLLERDSSMTERLELAQLEVQIMRMARKKLEVTEQDTLDYAQQVQELVEALKEDN